MTTCTTNTAKALSKRARRTLILQMGEAMRQYAQANTMAERLCLQETIESCRERLEHGVCNDQRPYSHDQRPYSHG